MSKICPTGFFCFDKSTFTLILVIGIVGSLYGINHNRDKLLKSSVNLQSDKKQFQELETQLHQQESKIKSLENTFKNEQHQKNHLQKIEDTITSNYMYTVEKDYQRVINPLMPPERSYPYRTNRIGVPINIPTRGESSHFQQVGALTSKKGSGEPIILPLYGKPTYPGSSKWLYYTGTDKYPSVKLPVNHKNKECQGDFGCEEIHNGDNIQVPAYGNDFSVSVYQLDKPRYIPYVY